MKFTYALAVTTALISSPAIAEKLYILNTGSTGGSYNAQTQAWAKDLADNYEIELIQSKGCQKATALMSKIDGNVLTMFSGNWVNREGCETLLPTPTTHVYTDQKIGLVFGKKGGVSELSDGATIAFNDGKDVEILALAKDAGIDLKPIEYKNSSEIALAVMNGEVDFGYTHSAKRVWKNIDKLAPIYNLSSQDLEGIPSITSIGGKAIVSTVNFVYFGDAKAALRTQMQEDRSSAGSAIGDYIDSQKGLRSTLMEDAVTSYNAFAETQ